MSMKNIRSILIPVCLATVLCMASALAENRPNIVLFLADDMGLGKTLQSICMLASDHKSLAERGYNVQSLVVCPTTLGGHWLEEITKFVSIQHLNPFLYYGSPNQRAGLRHMVAKHNLIITSCVASSAASLETSNLKDNR